MKTNKLFTYKDRQKTGNTRSELSLEAPDTNYISAPKVDNPSDGALLFQQGYMRKKDIKDILKEEELRCQNET